MKRSETSVKTERLWLREIDETDAECIVSLRSDESIYKYFLNPVRLTVEEHRKWYRKTYLLDYDRIDWIAIDDCDGTFIGVYGIKKVNKDIAEISYITEHDKRGRGYAKEAVSAIIGWGTYMWDIRIFTVNVHLENKKSISFAKTMGFDQGKIKEGCKGFIEMKLVLQ